MTALLGYALEMLSDDGELSLLRGVSEPGDPQLEAMCRSCSRTRAS
jgi:hypothetical protein